MQLDHPQHPFKKGRFYSIKKASLLLDPNCQKEYLSQAVKGEYAAVVLPEQAKDHPKFLDLIEQIKNHSLRPIVQFNLENKKKWNQNLFKDVSVEFIQRSEFSDWPWIIDFCNKDPWSHISSVLMSQNLDFLSSPRLPIELQSQFYFLYPLGKEVPSERTVGQWLMKNKNHLQGFLKSPLGVDVTDGFSEVELEPHLDPIFSRRNQSSYKISVVIPVFNKYEELKRVIYQLQKQTLALEDFEILIVDDGSEVGGQKEFLDFLKHTSIQVSYFYWPRSQKRTYGDGGFRVGSCRNFGVKESRSSQVVFLDSDILVPKDFLQTTLFHSQEHEVIQWCREDLTLASTQKQFQYENIQKKDLQIREGGYWQHFYQNAKEQSWNFIPDRWKFVSTYALSMKKNDFKKLGWFRNCFNTYGFEDTDLGYRAHVCKAKFFLVPRPVYHLNSGVQRSEYTQSRWRRHQLLKKSARLFYHNVLATEVYQSLRFLITGWPW